jgi:[ribosomal protein S18]-alanine N-acetyltransferase
MTGPGDGVPDGGLQDRVLTAEEARAIAAWSYEPPFDRYDLVPEDAVALLTVRTGEGYGYYPVQAGRQVVGFVCFGPEGRVTGQDPVPGTLDVGVGMDPGQVGQGLGTALVPQVLAVAAERFGARRLRAAVAAFNERSLRLCTSAGFRRVREFAGPGSRPFVELVLDL